MGRSARMHLCWCGGPLARKPHGRVADSLSAMPSSSDHRALFINKKDFLRGMTVAEMHLIRRAGSTPRPLLREDGEYILQGAMALLAGSGRDLVSLQGCRQRQVDSAFANQSLYRRSAWSNPVLLHIGEQSRHGRTWIMAPTPPAKPWTMHRTRCVSSDVSAAQRTFPT